MKILIVGMGFGNLYKVVHTELGHDVVTVDTNGLADFTDIDLALRAHNKFDVTHICTPNFTHVKLARKIAFNSKIVIIEKPGAANADAWAQLVKDYPDTRFMMSKNNMWRDNIGHLKFQAMRSLKVHLQWINKDRVPNPGTWFTTKSLAFGGVSRDLMPHLLSLYIALNPQWQTSPVTASGVRQQWKLSDLTQSDYGTVDANGTYDVDDFCTFGFGSKWLCTAMWRNNEQDRRQIDFETNDGLLETFELGLCPESAYKAMVLDAIKNVDNDEFWSNQYSQDMWIHTIIDTL
jgi:predicted dehydrogenase